MAWTCGIHPVEELLENDPDTLEEVWLVRSRRPGAALRRIRSKVEEHGIRYRIVSDSQLRNVLTGSERHQGVAARIADVAYADERTLLGGEDDTQPALIVALDRVQDPRNLGSIMRTACAMGARGVVVPKHHAVGVTTTVRKAAVGAASKLPVARVTNLARFLDQAKEAKYWVYGAMADADESLHDWDFARRVVIVLGGEEKGLRPNVLSRCDATLSIPMAEMESLNVGVATALLGYEWVRQHGIPTAGVTDHP